MSDKEKKLLVVAGPTASGKTALSIQLAQYFNAEIFSCDSRQFFAEMSIGTAKPDAAELGAAKHHFIGHLSIHQTYNAGDFEREALAAFDGYFNHQSLAIMTGGSGLYIKAVCEGVDYFPETPSNIRTTLKNLFEQQGIKVLQQELQAADPDYYNTVDIHNPQRIIRALEVYRSTGLPYSSFLGKNKVRRPFNIKTIGIDWPREQLYERINRRVDIMMQQGLLDEVQQLFPHRHLNALQTVGYRELFEYMEGKHSLDRAVELIKRNTRRYAKRQMTWFRKDKTILWTQPTDSFESVLDKVKW